MDTAATTVRSVLVVLLLPALLPAHPVPRRCHDRTVKVRLEEGRVVVDYRLEVDEFTVVFEDMKAIDDLVDTTKLHNAGEFYEAFTRCYAPILAERLVAKLNGKPLTFRCTARSHTLIDEKGMALGHLRCDFVFQADWKPGPGDHRFTFREGNYELESGRVRLALSGVPALEPMKKTEPDTALQERIERDLKPGDDDKLRSATASFHIGGVAAPPPVSNDAGAETAVAGKTSDRPTGLRDLLFDERRALWLLLVLAAGFGAVHALQPGHGKTLVAAYLVGERGTVGHAFLLGLATTLSHTGVVIAAAAILWYFARSVEEANIHTGLELIAGVTIILMGVWLLLRRLSGGADHFHLGGGHHHHHHGHEHDHSHADHVHDHAGEAPGHWGVIMMGLVGGMVPCWDAIMVLGLAVGKHKLWLALPLVLAFSAGLASVLVAIGVGIVYIKGFSESRWDGGKLVRSLPLISAALITLMGFWMCYEALHPGA